MQAALAAVAARRSTVSACSATQRGRDSGAPSSRARSRSAAPLSPSTTTAPRRPGPARPRRGWRIEPEKWNASGTSPSSRLEKYFAAAISRSNVHGTGIVNMPAPVNARHERRGLRPEEPVRRRGPALGLAEQVDEALARGGVVLAPGRLDVDLRGQRDREDLAPRGLGDAQAEAQRRRDRVLHDLDAEHRELGRDRRRQPAPAGTPSARVRSSRALPASAPKNSATASSIARPPEMPSQRDLIMPTSS